MDGLQDETKQIDEGARQQAPQRDDQDEASQTQVSAAVAGGDATAQAHADYESALKELDPRIAELEGEIPETAKTADAAEMDELRRQSDEQRIGFELQLAGVRNVKAARALLSDHDNDIEKLKAAEPRPFGEDAPAPAWAGAATDEGATMKRWREIAGLDEK